MNSITSESQIVEVFGLVLQFSGEGLICFGIIGAISGKVIANTEYNRQVLVASTVHNTQEQTALISGFKKSIDEQMTQLNFKLNQLQTQRSATLFAQSPVKCRFCGAKMDQSGFCPSCGKAN
jgi:tRNA(Ile2) C34 agmatinyltransferase TiaS